MTLYRFTTNVLCVFQIIHTCDLSGIWLSVLVVYEQFGGCWATEGPRRR